jgi:PAS domain S-box-containing protein
MLKELINEESLAEYTASFKSGQILFFEGDDSQDLYILLSGEIDILKGKKRIARIEEPGTLFGEMSFFMCAGRTATVKAAADSKVVKLPRDKISDFLREFPELAREIAGTLAKRLAETTSVAHGLGEFCDQVPEAVLVTDVREKILTWNKAAEDILERSEYDFRGRPLEDLFDEPDTVKSYVAELKTKYRPEKRLFSTTLPGSKKKRILKVSSTVLRDAYDGFQGVLVLITDVTLQQVLERKYRRIKLWIIPLAAIFFLGIGGAVYMARYFGPAQRSASEQLVHLGSLLSKDYLVLKSLLADPLAAEDREKIHMLLKDFLDIQKGHKLPYNGILLLDMDKKVIEACLTGEKTGHEEMIGQRYGGIEFKSGEKSPYSLLCLYRADKAHPMGKRCTEIAMEMRRNEDLVGYVIFQMDMPLIEATYGLTEQDLSRLNISGR